MQGHAATRQLRRQKTFSRVGGVLWYPRALPGENMLANPPFSILFVCLGNICRSPLAEGIMRSVAEERGMERQVLVDSAGTGGWHAGSAPDARSIAIAARHGIDISGQQARKVMAEDFDRFNLILGMDQSNADELRALAPARAQGRIHLFLELASGRSNEVPDPYYGGERGFADVYRMIRDGSEGLADRLGWRVLAALSGQASSTT